MSAGCTAISPGEEMPGSPFPAAAFTGTSILLRQRQRSGEGPEYGMLLNQSEEDSALEVQKYGTVEKGR